MLLRLHQRGAPGDKSVTDGNQKSIPYKSGTAETSIAILVVRVVVGMPVGLVAGFVGNIFNSVVVPSPVAGDVSAFVARMVVIGMFTATGGMLAWFNLFESKRGALLVWSISGVGAVLGALAAYYIGTRVIDHPDVYILSLRLSQAVLLGAALGSNAAAALLAIVASRIDR